MHKLCNKLFKQIAKSVRNLYLVNYMHGKNTQNKKDHSQSILSYIRTRFTFSTWEVDATLKSMLRRRKAPIARTFGEGLIDGDNSSNRLLRILSRKVC